MAMRVKQLVQWIKTPINNVKARSPGMMSKVSYIQLRTDFGKGKNWI
jgi:hypothetical protein